MQDFDLEFLPTEGEHSQMVKGPSVGKDSGSKDCINLPSSTAVSRIIDLFRTKVKDAHKKPEMF